MGSTSISISHEHARLAAHHAGHHSLRSHPFARDKKVQRTSSRALIAQLSGHGVNFFRLGYFPC